jgi:hypothetical protein
MRRYAAKLLLQFRVTVDGSDGTRRTCEERIVVLQARSAAEALRRAKRRGRSAELRYRNNDGNPVHIEFIGVMELLRLDPVCAEDEVWYDIRDRILPKERAERFIPPEHTLEAIRNEAEGDGPPEVRVRR